MISVNRQIDRKKIEAFGLLSSSVSGHKKLGQPIEVVLEVLEQLIKEAPSATVRQKLENERMDAVRRYNPSLMSTMGRYQDSLKTTDAIIHGARESSKKILDRSKISTEIMHNVYQGNKNYPKSYGAWAKNTAFGRATEPAKRAFSVQVFSNQKSAEQLEKDIAAQVAFIRTADKSVTSHIQAAKADIALKQVQMEMQRVLKSTAKAAGIPDENLPSLFRSLQTGANRLKKIEDVIQMETGGEKIGFDARRNILKEKFDDEFLYGYKRGEYQAAKREYNIKISSKKQQDFKTTREFSDLLRELNLDPDDVSPNDFDDLESRFLKATGQEPLSYSEYTPIDRGLPARTIEDEVDEFVDLFHEKLRGNLFDEDYEYGFLKEKITNIYELNTDAAVKALDIDFDETITPGKYGLQPFATGELSELHKMRLYFERLKQKGNRPLVNEIIKNLDSAIIAAGGNTREIGILSRYGKATGMYQARAAILAEADASVLSAWQNIYGGLQLNTGFGSSVPASMQGQMARMTGLKEQFRTLKIQGLDEVASRYLGKDYKTEEKILDRIDVTVESRITKEMLEQTTTGLSLAPQLGRGELLRAAAEVSTATANDINYSNVYAVMRSGQNRVANQIIRENRLASAMAEALRAGKNINISSMATSEEIAELFYDVFPKLSQSVNVSLPSAAAKEAAQILESRTRFTMVAPRINVPELKPFEEIMPAGKTIFGYSGTGKNRVRTMAGADSPEFFNYITKEIEDELRPVFRLSEEQSKLYAKYSKHVGGLTSRLSSAFYEATNISEAFSENKALAGSTRDLFNDMTRYVIANILEANNDMASSLNLGNQGPVNTLTEFQRVFEKTIEETEGLGDYFRLLGEGKLGEITRDAFGLKAISIDKNPEVVDAIAGQDIVGSVTSPTGKRRSIAALSSGLDSNSDDIDDLERTTRQYFKGLLGQLSIAEKSDPKLIEEALSDIAVVDNSRIMDIIDEGKEGNDALLKVIEQIKRSYVDNKGSKLNAEIIQNEANKLLNIKDVRRFNFGVVDTDLGEMIELTGYNDVTRKDVRYSFLSTPKETKLVFGTDYIQKADVRMRDLVYHTRTYTDRVRDILTEGAEERFGAGFTEKVPEIARDYLGMDINIYDKATKEVIRTMTHTEIIDAVASTNDLPIHMFEGGIEKGALYNAMYGLEDLSADKTLLRTPELFWIAMQEESLAAGSDTKRITEAVKAMGGAQLPKGVTEADLMQEIQERFKTKVKSSGVGNLVEDLVREEIDAPLELARRLPSIVPDTIALAQKYWSEIKTGDFAGGPRWTKNVALATIALLGASAIYKTGKDIIGTDSGNGPETRIAMNDEGYGNSSTPTRYDDQSGGINTSGSNPFAGLSSLRLSDNMNDINDIELDRMMSEM